MPRARQNQYRILLDFQKQINASTLQISGKTETEETLSDTFYEAAIPLIPIQHKDQANNNNMPIEYRCENYE